MRRFEKGSILFEENEDFNHLMYILFEGETVVFKKTQIDQILVDAKLQKNSKNLNDLPSSIENQPKIPSLKRKLEKQTSILLNIGKNNDEDEYQIQKGRSKSKILTSYNTNTKMNDVSETNVSPNNEKKIFRRGQSITDFVNNKFTLLQNKRNSILSNEDCLNDIEIYQYYSMYGEPIRIMQAPEAIGDISFLENKPRTATVITFTECKLITLNKNDFQELIKNYEFTNKLKRKIVASSFGFSKVYSSNVFENFFFSFSQKTLKKGQLITHQGDRGKYLFIILEGSISIMKNKTQLCVIGKGELIGEELLFDYQEYLYEARVLSSTASLLVATIGLLEVKLPIDIKSRVFQNLNSKIQFRNLLYSKSKLGRDIVEEIQKKNKQIHPNTYFDIHPEHNSDSKELLASYFTINCNVKQKIELFKEFAKRKNGNSEIIGFFPKNIGLKSPSQSLNGRFRSKEEFRERNLNISPPFKIRKDLKTKYENFHKNNLIKDLPGLKSCFRNRKLSFQVSKTKYKTDRDMNETNSIASFDNNHIFQRDSLFSFEQIKLKIFKSKIRNFSNYNI